MPAMAPAMAATSPTAARACQSRRVRAMRRCRARHHLKVRTPAPAMDSMPPIDRCMHPYIGCPTALAQRTSRGSRTASAGARAMPTLAWARAEYLRNNIK